MKMGTKSVLFGAHCFPIHGWFVAAAWWKLFGFPWDPRLWCAFFLHDLGYIGKPNMDGPEGERHPYTGAMIMQEWFDNTDSPLARFLNRHFGEGPPRSPHHKTWYEFVLYHSRYLAKRDGRAFSVLCVADKLGITLEPVWMYLPRVYLSGELAEYLGDTEKNHPDMGLSNKMSPLEWHANVKKYCREWVAEHKDGRQDTWTQVREH